jgi:AP-2 complex subunit beta-1
MCAMFFPPDFRSYRHSGQDSSYSQSLAAQQGKVAELRLELNSGGKKDKNHTARKIALKKIVANMTMSNNDMVALFPDIVNCMHISNLEIKKMYAIRLN